MLKLETLGLGHCNKTKWIWIYDRDKRLYKAILQINRPCKAIKGHTKTIQGQQGHTQWNSITWYTTKNNTLSPLGLYELEILTHRNIFSHVSTTPTTRTAKLLLGPLSKARGQKHGGYNNNLYLCRISFAILLAVKNYGKSLYFKVNTRRCFETTWHSMAWVLRDFLDYFITPLEGKYLWKDF